MPYANLRDLCCGYMGPFYIPKLQFSLVSIYYATFSANRMATKRGYSSHVLPLTCVEEIIHRHASGLLLWGAPDE